MILLKQIFLLYLERSDFFLKLLWEHIWISLSSIGIAIVIGLSLGIAISEYRKSSSPVLAIVNFLYTIPAISLLGFLIPFSGVGNTTAIIALTTYALLPMLRNTYTGLQNIDAGIIEAARGMGSTNAQILYKIKLPLAVPVILSGLRNMVVMTISLTGIASFIGAGGLGVAIYRGITTNNALMTLAGSLLIAVLALLSDAAIGFAEKTRQKRKHTRVHEDNIPKPSLLRTWPAGSLLLVLLLVLAIWGGWSLFRKKQTIHIATKPMSEQYILGSMLALLIENETPLKVEITQGVGGGTANIHPAMLKGEFDIYPEYTGTAWNYVLKEKVQYKESMFPNLKKKYLKKYNLAWVGMYGFNNTYGLAVRKKVAEKYRLKTYSDLARVAPLLRFGAEYDFYEREDGFDNLSKAYSYRFKSKIDLDIGLKYQALLNDKIDVMNIFTTDGQLSSDKIVVLQDDKNFYPSYRCGNIVRKEILQKHPSLQSVLLKLQNILDEKQMAYLNHLVESENINAMIVASDFLISKGLLPKEDL